MPFPTAIGGALINGITSLFGQSQANQQNAQNAENQAIWNRENQTSQQQFDYRMWNEMNRYNSPQAQMARFGEAGLNPHLIYGKGTPGNTTQLKAPDIKPYNRAEARSVTEGMDVFGDYNRFKQLEAQTNNLDAQTNVAEQQALLTGTKNAREVFAFARDNKFSFAEAEAALDLLKNQGRSAAANADVAEGTKQTRIDQANATLSNTLKTGDLQEQQKAINAWELSLHELGLTRTDPGWWRMLATNFDSLKQMLTATEGILSIPPQWMTLLKQIFIGSKFIQP